MSDAPERLWLQWYEDAEVEDVTWCIAKASPRDVEYLRADKSQDARLAALEARVKELEAALTLIADMQTDYLFGHAKPNERMMKEIAAAMLGRDA